MMESILIVTLLVAFIIIVLLVKRIREQQENSDNLAKQIRIYEGEIKVTDYLEKRLRRNEELLYMLTDIMHNEHIFEILTVEEINNLFKKARLVTCYRNGQVSIENIETFIQKVQNEILPLLYTGIKDYDIYKPKGEVKYWIHTTQNKHSLFEIEMEEPIITTK